MTTAGIDSGAKNVKAVIMRDGKIVGKSTVPAGLDAKAAANQAYDEALKAAGLKRSDIQKVLVTGAGKKDCDFAQGKITEVGAAAKGISYIMPNARTVIAVGAEEGSAVKVNEKGNVVDFAINEKCAAGAGTFVEAMARALETQVEKMAELYDQSTKEVDMNAQCAVFAESELVSLVHSQTAKPDIARAVLTAIADRIVSMMRRIGIENEVVAIGGVALNNGFIKAVEKELNIKITVPADPQFVSAIGVAIAAAE
ncbi:MAG: acyl-CoA dehydratase activase [Proteobacteria bacterium]|nr:acyl-CoA dehydratase activase [Pseudomonadota bacterium]